MEEYVYGITEDFPNQRVDLQTLTSEIEDSSISTALDHITTDEDTDECGIFFESALSSGDETTLNGVVAAHQGNPPTTFDFKAPSKLIAESVDVTNDATWQDLGGSVTTISAFVPDVTKAWGRFVAQVKISGTGAKLQVIRDSDGEPCMAAPYEHADTSGAWEIVQFWVNQNQPEGTDCFILQGKLDGATSFEVRYGTLSLMEKVN